MPESPAICEEDRRLIRDALDGSGLSDRERRAILEKYWESRPDEEIAAALCVSR